MGALEQKQQLRVAWKQGEGSYIPRAVSYWLQGSPGGEVYPFQAFLGEMVPSDPRKLSGEGGRDYPTLTAAEGRTHCTGQAKGVWVGHQQHPLCFYKPASNTLAVLNSHSSPLAHHRAGTFTVMTLQSLFPQAGLPFSFSFKKSYTLFCMTKCKCYPLHRVGWFFFISRMDYLLILSVQKPMHNSLLWDSPSF